MRISSFFLQWAVALPMTFVEAEWLQKERRTVEETEIIKTFKGLSVTSCHLRCKLSNKCRLFGMKNDAMLGESGECFLLRSEDSKYSDKQTGKTRELYVAKLLDPCLQTPCHFDAICSTNTKDGHTCTCKPGYSGNNVDCVDNNECIDGSYPCSSLVSCTNTPGSYLCGPCPQGYTGNGTQCKAIYMYHATQVNWSQAVSTCRQRKHGYLATITSQAQNTYLVKELEKREIGNVWIGYNDKDKEGSFVWNDPDGISNYTNWKRSNEPNGGTTENCAEIVPAWSGTWNDAKCHESRAFICQKGGH